MEGNSRCGSVGVVLGVWVDLGLLEIFIVVVRKAFLWFWGVGRRNFIK